MAASAYAATVSLLNTMDQIQIHPRLFTCFDNYQFQSLRKIVCFLVDFVENYSEAEDLVRRIADAAHKAEDLIEVEAADRIRGGSTTKSLTLLLNLQRVIEEMDSIKENAMEVKEESGFINSMASPPSASASAPLATTKTSMVGFDSYLAQLLDQLTAQRSHRQILPIVGMGGIGKTTLARNVYENSLILYHFDVHAWVTVSQEYIASHILLQALCCLGESKSMKDRNGDEIGEKLYKILSGRRYLIVLDDVWSIEAWEKIQFYFPENYNGSRIIVTTRQREVVNYFGSSSLALDFLDDKHSWDLFCAKTFAPEGCPPILEEVGRKIVKKCRGLPLAITVIGGLLGKSPRKLEYWEKIAKDKSLDLENSGAANKALSLLYLSYKHLPVWLKSCFLYLGLFPEDHQIDVPRLVKLWVAEGLIKPNAKQSLEDVAESYVKDLIDRNLLIVGDWRLNLTPRICWVHDLVREMCIRVAENENFYCVQRDIAGKRQFIVHERTVSFYPPKSLSSEKPSVNRPVMFRRQQEVPFKCRLLRVLVDEEGCLGPSFEQVNLRFLSHTSTSLWSIPQSISLCWSLQTLIVRQFCSVSVPSEIWKMQQLRHIEMWQMHLPDPPLSDTIVLHNLQTLKTVNNLTFTKEVCKRIPNIKELEIHYNLNDQVGESWFFHLHNVGCLSNVELLQFSCSVKEYAGDPIQNLKLPSSLKELVLSDCKLAWNAMAMIASLPHLQILQLRWKAVVGPNWCYAEEEFRCLKHLSIGYCDDEIKWIADRSNFPVLETLHLEGLSKLEEIPWGIGEVPTLQKMYVSNCSESATVSAIKILDEQESLGNQDLHLQLAFFNKIEAEMWRGKIQELGFTCQNLHICSLH